MDRETYTIEDVAQMTGLSSRTIRTYRKMGLLGGALQGNTWTFTPEQVGKLLNEPYVQGAIEAKRNAIWTGFLQDTGKQVPSLCTTADFPATDAQGANALLDRLLEQLPAGVRMNYCYDHRRNLVRIYLSGPKDSDSAGSYGSVMQPRTEPGDGKMPMGCRDRPFSVAVSYPPCTIEGIKMVKYGGNLLPGAGPCVLPAETPCGSLPVFGEFGMPTTGGHMGPPLRSDPNIVQERILQPCGRTPSLLAL